MPNYSRRVERHGGGAAGRPGPGRETAEVRGGGGGEDDAAPARPQPAGVLPDACCAQRQQSERACSALAVAANGDAWRLPHVTLYSYSVLRSSLARRWSVVAVVITVLLGLCSCMHACVLVVLLSRC